MEDITRRDLLHKTINSLIGLWVAATSVLSGYAGIRYIWPTEKTAGPPGEKKISFPIVELQEGGMKKILIDGKQALPRGILTLQTQGREVTIHRKSLVL